VDHHWWLKLFKKRLQNDSGPEAANREEMLAHSTTGVHTVQKQLVKMYIQVNALPKR
jgi:hypothetical protein